MLVLKSLKLQPKDRQFLDIRQMIAQADNAEILETIWGHIQEFFAAYGAFRNWYLATLNDEFRWKCDKILNGLEGSESLTPA